MTTERFDAQAAVWDEEPRRRALSQAIVAAILGRIGIRPGLRVLDLGCGTGLVGLPLAAAGASLLGIDLSEGMLAVFHRKAQAAGLTVRAECRDLTQNPLPPGSIDLAVSAMAFHHMPDVDAMLRALAASLAPGGRVAIADLEEEDGSFHDEPVPHRGFAPAAFSARLAAAGFASEGHQRVHAIAKHGRDYPVFLACARRG